MAERQLRVPVEHSASAFGGSSPSVCTICFCGSIVSTATRRGIIWGCTKTHDPRLLEKRREHYRNNKQTYLNRVRQREREMREFLAALKSTPCADCEVSYPPFVMDLDHRDPEHKVDTIDKIIHLGSWRKFYEEIAKCDVVCANCHRVRTYGGDERESVGCASGSPKPACEGSNPSFRANLV